jgi:hypothetical protein
MSKQFLAVGDHGQVGNITGSQGNRQVDLRDYAQRIEGIRPDELVIWRGTGPAIGPATKFSRPTKSGTSLR